MSASGRSDLLAGIRFALLCATATAGTACPAHAAPPTLQALIGNPDDFSLSGSVRVRHEVLDGQPRTGLRATDEQLALRTTLAAQYHRDNWRIGAELFDSRAYLDEANSAISANEVNALELVQAYAGADFANALGRGSMVQVQAGRMMLNLGSRRLVAADDYRNTTNGYTGIRADLKARDGSNVTLIYTLPQERLPSDLPSIRKQRVRMDRESLDLRLWGALAARPRTLAGATAELGYFGLQEADNARRATRDRDLHTISARIIRDPRTSRADFEVEGIYQFGKASPTLAANAPLLNVSAWFVHVDAGYLFPGPAKLHVSVEYDYASGDGPGGSYGRFDTLFGMRRADLAPAGIYNALARTNINTPAIRVEGAPTKRLDAFAAYRAMWLADRTDAFSSTGVRDPSGQSGSFAGHQLEARVRYWLMPGFLRGELDGLWLAKGHFLKEAPNAPQTGDTLYIASALTATF